jgi:hypothetical protein
VLLLGRSLGLDGGAFRAQGKRPVGSCEGGTGRVLVLPVEEVVLYFSSLFYLFS